MIGNLLQADLEELIRAQNWNELRDAVSGLDPSDIAEIIIDLPPDDEGVIFRVLPRDLAGAVFSHLPLEQQEELIGSISNDQSRQILEQMQPDDRARLLEEMPAEVTRRLLESLTPEQLKATRFILGYPENTAGRYMTPEYVSLKPSMTAREALEHVRKTGRGKETLSMLYVVDEQGILVDDLRLGILVMADPDAKIADIQDRALVSIPVATDRAGMVAAFEKYDRAACNKAYMVRAYGFYQPKHLDRAVAMIFKACGFKPHSLGYKLATKVAWWQINRQAEAGRKLAQAA